MLSFNNLGNLGRLANQMFQYASLKGIASHRGYEYCIPPKEFFGKTSENFDMYFSFLPKECNKTKKGTLSCGTE